MGALGKEGALFESFSPTMCFALCWGGDASLGLPSLGAHPGL